MIWAIVIGGVVVYVVTSYVVVARWLDDSPGPAGLGWLAWPASPIILPLVGLGMLKALIHNWTR
jgi:hypothetical protein